MSEVESEAQAQPAKQLAFAEGDRVAWSHEYATQHGTGSVAREEAVGALAPDARFGVVTGQANEEGTYWRVALDDGTEMVLTEQELVKVAP